MVCRLWESYSFRNDFPDGDIRDTLAFYGQRIRLCWYSYGNEKFRIEKKNSWF